MDSWLKYSKKTLAKSDENTELLIRKVGGCSERVEHLQVKRTKARF